MSSILSHLDIVKASDQSGAFFFPTHTLTERQKANEETHSIPDPVSSISDCPHWNRGLQNCERQNTACILSGALQGAELHIRTV